MNETTSKGRVPSCPHCGSKEFFHSRKRGLKDWFLHHVLFQNPYRCGTCDARFFRLRHSHNRREQVRHHV